MFLTSTYGNEGTFMENFVAMAFSKRSENIPVLLEENLINSSEERNERARSGRRKVDSLIKILPFSETHGEGVQFDRKGGMSGWRGKLKA
jgi:hypothetical protein